MATPKYTALATLTLSSTASSVTFGSIPAGYRDLILVTMIRSTRASEDYTTFRINGDSGSNYSWVGMGGNGSSAFSFTGSGTSLPTNPVACAADGAGIFSQITYQFMDYSATDKHKAILLSNQDINTVSTNEVLRLGVRYASTTALNSITCDLQYENFAVGSTFDLFGVK